MKTRLVIIVLSFMLFAACGKTDGPDKGADHVKSEPAAVEVR